MSDEVLFELRKINKLLAISITEDKSFNDKIQTLKNAGFSSNEIADILNISADTIRSQLSKMKKKRTK